MTRSAALKMLCSLLSYKLAAWTLTIALPYGFATCTNLMQVEGADGDDAAGTNVTAHKAVQRTSLSSNLHLTAAAAPFVPPALEDLSEASMADCLDALFGYKGFRGLQLQVVKNIMAGQSTLAILPTGIRLACVCS